MKTEASGSIANLNTILLAIVLGVMSWIGYTVQQTSVAIAVLGSTNANHERELLELRARVQAVEIQLAQFKRTP
jgi:hypothetical protein